MSKMIRLYLSDEEHAAVERAVSRSGLTHNAWLRETLALRFEAVDGEAKIAMRNRINELESALAAELMAQWEAEKQAYLDAWLRAIQHPCVEASDSDKPLTPFQKLRAGMYGK